MRKVNDSNRKSQHRPHGAELQPSGVTEPGRRRVGKDQTRNHHSQEARGFDALCHEVDRERGEQGDGVLDERVVVPIEQPPQSLLA
jgi:hypothetical protein